jgi:hypothetical protein
MAQLKSPAISCLRGVRVEASRRWRRQGGVAPTWVRPEYAVYSYGLHAGLEASYEVGVIGTCSVPSGFIM